MYDDYNDDYQDGSDTEDDDDDENERPYTSTPQSMPFKFINGKDGMGKIYLPGAHKFFKHVKQQKSRCTLTELLKTMVFHLQLLVKNVVLLE